MTTGVYLSAQDSCLVFQHRLHGLVVALTLVTLSLCSGDAC